MVQLEAVMVAETMGVAATVEVEQAVEVMEAGAEVAVGLAEGEAVEVVLAVEGLAEEGRVVGCKEVAVMGAAALVEVAKEKGEVEWVAV